jgi:hypothetical protein
VFNRTIAYRDKKVVGDNFVRFSCAASRAKLVTKKTKRDQYLKQSFVLQNQINEKHETLRNNADGT